VSKKAPVSGVESLMDYEVTFVGEIVDGAETFTLKVLGAGHEPLPVLEEDLRARRAQPALARDRRREDQDVRVDRGDHRPRSSARPRASSTGSSSAPTRSS
jgi:hypothetical protein